MAAKVHLVVFAELVDDGSLNGLGGRSVIRPAPRPPPPCLPHPHPICPLRLRPRRSPARGTRTRAARFGFRAGARTVRTRHTSGGGATRWKTQSSGLTRRMRARGRGRKEAWWGGGDDGAGEGRREEWVRDAEEGARERRLGGRLGHRRCGRQRNEDIRFTGAQ
jgi:hypothetical protein